MTLNMDLIYPFQGELWHRAQPTLIYVLYTIQYVFVLVNKCSSQVNCEYYSFFHYYVFHRCVTHTHTHTNHIRLRERSSVRLNIIYGILTPTDVIHRLRHFFFTDPTPSGYVSCRLRPTLTSDSNWLNVFLQIYIYSSYFSLDFPKSYLITKIF